MNGGRAGGDGQPGSVPPRADLRTPAVALAANLLVAIVWLISLLILALFLAVASGESG